MEKLKVLVVNEMEMDVFSEHFLKNNEFELTRLGFNQAMEQGDSYDRVLLVNGKISLAYKLKEIFPSSRLISLSGGYKDFQPYLVVVHGQDDLDYWSYSSWTELIKLIKSEARQKRIFNALPGFAYNYFDLSLKKSWNKLELMDDKSAKLIANSSNVSLAYLGFIQNWLSSVRAKLFPVKDLSFDGDDLVKGFSITLENNYEGLPIFCEGDSVSLFDGCCKKMTFTDSSRDSMSYRWDYYIPSYEEKSFITNSLTKVEENKIYVSFSKPVPSRKLRNLNFIKANLSMTRKRNEAMLESLKDYQTMLSNPDFQAEFSLPAVFLASSKNFPLLEKHLAYPSTVELNDYEKKIFRDLSQQKALMDMLSDRPISVVIGPAGTGKTFVAAIAARYYVKEGDVMLLSHSNVAVDVLTSETKKYLDHSLIYRLGNKNKIAMENQDLIRDKLASTNPYTNQGRIVACTIDSFFSLEKKLKESCFRPAVIICDEASRGLFPEHLALIMSARKKIIFIGDNKQLGGLPLEEAIEKNLLLVPSISPEKLSDFAGGFFNMIIKNEVLPYSMLRINRRSLPNISELVNKISYQGKLFPGRFNPNQNGEIILLDTSKMKTKEVKRKKSWLNKLEVNLLVRRFIHEAVKHVSLGGSLLDCAIITPYSGQEEEVKQSLRKHLLFHIAFQGKVLPENINGYLDKIVATVDSMQGGERELILLSLVRANDENNIGFNSDLRRLNVSISRARNKLLIFGDLKTFLESENSEIAKAFSLISSHVKKHGVYVELN